MNADDIKKAIDLAEYIRSRGVVLRKRGKDLVGLCPFHKDTKPSLVVTPSKRLWHCLGCGAGGSVIDFVMKLDGLDVRGAIEKLGGPVPAPQRPPAPEDPAPAVPALSPERANQLLERVVSLYEKTFADVPEGRAYLESRGITDAGLFSAHRVGYCNGRLPELLPSDGRLKEELAALGVLLPGAHERFTGCVVFPVLDADGGLTTLYGRFTGDPSSSKDSAATRGDKRHLFLPNRPTGLWNAAAAKTYGELILVESVIDALSVIMAGVGNVVSIQGTTGRGDADLAPLTEGGVRKLVLLLDGDAPGQAATLRLKEKIVSCQLPVVSCQQPVLNPTTILPFSCRRLTLPDGHDPDACLTAHGPHALAAFLAGAADARGSAPCTPGKGPLALCTPDLSHQAPAPQAGHPAFESAAAQDTAIAPTAVPSAAPVPSQPAADSKAMIEGSGESMTPRRGPGGGATSRGTGTASPLPLPDGFALAYGLRRYEVRGLEKGVRKLKATVRVEHAGRLHVDTLDFYSARARRVLCQDLCRVFEQPAETIDADLTKLMSACESFDPASVKVADPATPAESMTAAERKEAEAFGKSPELIARILADFETGGLVGEKANKLLCYLAMTSRKTADPLSVLILSSSGAGKTALQDAALAFGPPEDVVKLTSLTGKALFYKDETSLMHKVLALEEGAGAEEAAYAIRNLISAKELVVEATIKDLITGRLTTMANRVKGPTSVFYTVTDPEVDPETRSRFWVLGIDESREQTDRILEFQRQRQTLTGLRGDVAADPVVSVHRNFQRLLRPLAVVNPYASALSYGDTRLQARRDQPKYLNLIKAVAFLRQMQKPVRTWVQNGRGVEYIEVDLDDIRIANELAVELLARSLDELSHPARSLLEQLETLADTRLAAGGDPEAGRLSVSFTRREVREFSGWSNYRVHTHLKELVEYEYVQVDAGRNGVTGRYRLVCDGRTDDGRRLAIRFANPDELRRDPAAGPAPEAPGAPADGSAHG